MIHFLVVLLAAFSFSKTPAVCAVYLPPKCDVDDANLKTDCSGRELKSTIIFVKSNERKKIESINFSNNNIEQVNGLEQFPNLKTLDLSLNLIENMSSDAFSTLEKLSYIDLSYNNIEKVNPYTFINNKQLKNLTFQGNLLTVTPDSPIICSASLQVLNLGTCGLSSLTIVNFLCLPFLTELNLSSNGITSLTPSVFSPLPRLEIINLGVNRFSCDCKLPELLQWAKLKTTDLSNPESVYCVLSNNRGRRVFTSVEKDLNCSRESPVTSAPLTHQNDNSSSEYFDYILISADTNIHPDGDMPTRFMGLISSILYVIEAVLSLVVFLLVLIMGMLFCRHQRTVSEVSDTVSQYSNYDHFSPDKMSTHLISKGPKDHMYVHVK